MLSRFRGALRPLVEDVARVFIRTGISPNALTWLGLLVGVFTAISFAAKLPQVAGACLLVYGLFDIVDGAVARLTFRESAFGGLLDSVADRYGEFLIYLGIIYGDLAALGLPSWAWGTLALGGSFMVSYTRARAELAGSGKLAVGLAERPERILILAIGSLLAFTNYAVALIAILSHLTAIHRLLVAKKRLES